MCSVATHGTLQPLTKGTRLKYIAKEALIDLLVELNSGQAPATTLGELGIADSTASRACNNYRMRPETAYRIASLLDRKVSDLFEAYKPRKHGSRRTKAGRVVPNGAPIPAPPGKPGPKPELERAAKEDADDGDDAVSVKGGYITIRVKLSDYTGEELVALMQRVK